MALKYHMFYKIYCKDPEVKEIYVGRSSNINAREELHKNTCKGLVDVKVYNYINKNGGWGNWNMEIIDFKKTTLKDACKIEEDYRVKLNASLNSIKCFKDVVPKIVKDEKILWDTNFLLNLLNDLGCDLSSYTFNIKKPLTKEKANDYQIKRKCNDKFYDLENLKELNICLKKLFVYLNPIDYIASWKLFRPRDETGEQRHQFYIYTIKDEQKGYWDILVEKYEMGH